MDLLRRAIYHVAFDPSFLRFFLPPAGHPARPLIPILAPFHPSHAVLPRWEIAISRRQRGWRGSLPSSSRRQNACKLLASYETFISPMKMKRIALCADVLFFFLFFLVSVIDLSSLAASRITAWLVPALFAYIFILKKSCRRCHRRRHYLPSYSPSWLILFC